MFFLSCDVQTANMLKQHVLKYSSLKLTKAGETVKDSGVSTGGTDVAWQPLDFTQRTT